MALRLRRDIKKSSYYVWFLGAKESQGLRGEEYVIPVIQHLIERERDIEPFKVTLQVSHKGLKIIQNIVTTNVKNLKPKNETIKHFIPHNTITCVYQQEDIVACILLLFNPVTKCPLHVHAYRCDSLETATLLKSQLQILIERPENQKKLLELEHRLKIKTPSIMSKNYISNNKTKKIESSLGSDTGTSTRESESSEERFSNETRVATLYDSLAAELRQKLGKNDPILLPPRDYDTVHRQQGNLTGIELRRSLNTNIVGANIKNGVPTTGARRGLESSGGSSGIGSDHAPSPDGKEDGCITQENNRYNTLDNPSSSDEDWNNEPIESTLYLMHGLNSELPNRLRGPISNPNRLSASPSPPRGRANIETNQIELVENKRSPKYSNEINDNKYSNKIEPNKKKYFGIESPKYSPNKYIERSKSPVKYSKNDQFYPSEHSYKTLKNEKNSPKNESRYHSNQRSVEERRYIQDNRYQPDNKPDYEDCPRYFNDESPVAIRRRAENRQRSPSPKRSLDKKTNGEIDTGTNISPRDRFKDAKEKFLSLEKQRLEEQERLAALRKVQEKPISPVNTRNFPRNWIDNEREFEVKRDQNLNGKNHDNLAYQRKYNKDINRYPDKERRYYPEIKNNSDQYESDRYHDSPKYRESDKVKYFNRYNESSDIKRKEDAYRYEDELRTRYNEGKGSNLQQYVKEDKDKYIEKHNDHNERTSRQFDDHREYPKPVPRNIKSDAVYRDEFKVPLERYRSPERYVDHKRRSMYNLIEDEHKRTSSEIAKELKRRSYMENQDRYYGNERYYRNENKSNATNTPYGELNEQERYPGLDRDDYRISKSTVDLDKMGRKMSPRAMAKSTLELDQRSDDNKYIIKSPLPQHKVKSNAAGYRHSYAEPKLRMERIGGKKMFPELLHRTNSTVSNSGRVGIASIHPY